MLKHLRQRGLLKAFEALQESLPSTSALQLEDPTISEVHRYLVEQGDFDGTEELLANIAHPHRSDGTSGGSAASLFDAYCKTATPIVQWTRLDDVPGTATWDGEQPSARGGHQMVLVRGSHAETKQTDFEDTSSPSYLYLFGGWNGITELADLWRFNLQEQRWELLSPDTSGDMALGPDGARIFGPDPRSCHQMAVDQETGDIYMLGRFMDAQSSTRQGPSTQEEDSTMDSGSGGRPSQDNSHRQNYPSVPGDQEAFATTVPRSRETSDFWVLHTRGDLRDTWEMLSEIVEVSLVRRPFYQS